MSENGRLIGESARWPERSSAGWAVPGLSARRWRGQQTAFVTLVALSGWVAASRVQARTFADILGTPITQKVGEALATSIGRALPVTSASAGIVFHFEPATGVFER